MDDITVKADNLGIWDSLKQLVAVLGFHDMTSFFITSVFLVFAVGFIVSGAIFLVKKRRERMAALLKIVHEVQSEKLVDSIAKDKEDVIPAAFRNTDVTLEDKKPQPEPSDTKLLEKSEPKPQLDAIDQQPLIDKAQEKIKKTPAKPQAFLDEKIATKKSQPIEAPEKKAKKPAETQALVDEKIVAKIKPQLLVDEEITQTKSQPLVSTEEKIAKADPKTKALTDEKPQESLQVIAVPDTRKELGAALKNTRGGFLEKLSRLWSRGPLVSDADFVSMEEILFTADIGAKTAQKLLDAMRERAKIEKTADVTVLRSILKEEMCRILESVKSPRHDDTASLRVVMMVGVNGAGKTTSIAKLGAKYKTEGKSVLFGAGDTFRAAAVEQLKVWGNRVGAEVVSGKENSDSAAVLFEAIEYAKKNQMDFVLCDTAGRLHTKLSLMDELKKVHRVMGKAVTGAPHEVLLVIDATMGQNAINQAREFALAAPLTGVVLSKLDGTAKGGVALGIVDELKVPIRYIGIGEKMNDLKDFDAKMFVDALFDEV